MMDWVNFRKPQRYVGGEWNMVKKTHRGKIKVVLCYPDLYEVGMSNLGLRIIYGSLNNIDDVVCERAFMPGLDLADYLEKNKKKLFSLETKTSLDTFDVIGFNFSCELNFTNFLYMLTLAGLPVEKKQRKDTIVLGGAILNPEPLSSFVDVFFMGEFEEKTFEFVSVLRRYKDKESRLKNLAEIGGFYIPEFYDVQQKERRYYFSKKYKYAKLPVRKEYVKDLNYSYYPSNWLTPYTRIVHDRAQVEIARGCPNSCFFCQARSSYYPYREKRVDHILNCLEEIYKNSGYENFSFLSLSASDYSQIDTLIDKAGEIFKDKGVGLSLPSLRVDDIIGRLYKKLLRIKKTSLTLAIEAATPGLRGKINKNIDVGAFMEAKDIIKSLNLKHIKFYFMFGLPFETGEDIFALGELSGKMSRDLGINLNISINAFIPKPFSHFQGKPMEKEEILVDKKRMLLKSIKRRRIKVSIADIKKSLLEAAISRGDRSLSRVIHRAFLSGARFDSYTEYFKWEIWEEAFKQEGIDPRYYLEDFPGDFAWSHIRVE